MEKQPFDQAGLQAVLQALYALPQNELNEQADALRTLPKQWINNHFELDNDQSSFLNSMPEQTIRFLGDQGSFAIENSLPIDLDKQEPSLAERKPDKYFKPKSTLYSQTNSNGLISAGGRLIIEVSYSDA